MTEPSHIVVVGAGLGGVRTVEHLRRAGFDGRISLIGGERHQPYDRPPLSKQVLSGAWEPDRATLRAPDALAGLNVELRLGVAAVALHRGAVELADRTRVTGDAVVVATGSAARRLPGQPAGVHTLRTLDDALELRDALSGAGSMVIVGGGFIGAEVASCARDRGVEVTVLEALPVPCERALGPRVGELCARLLAEAGVRLRCDARPVGFPDAGTVELAGGERVAADVVLVGVGAAPAVEWLRAGELGEWLDTGNGLACDEQGRVRGALGVWAVGDVAAWQDPVRGARFRTEHWTGANDQAAVVAKDILGAEPPRDAVPYFWSDQFGLKIQMFGRPDLADTVVPLLGDGMSGGTVRGTVVGYLAAGRLVAVVGFGAAKQVARYRPLVARAADEAEVLAAG